MPGVVHLYRNAAEAHGRDLFACSLAEWRFLLELGLTFGWQARGTTYQLPANSKLSGAALRDYEPGNAADPKVVDEEDAMNWARSLEEAKKSPHFSALLEARLPSSTLGSTTQSVAHSLDEFIQYVYGGRFVFANADSASGATD